MSKQKYKVNVPIRGFDLSTLVRHYIDDCSVHTDRSVFERILSVPTESMRSEVEVALYKAESELAFGRGSDYIALRQLDAFLKKNVSFCPLTTSEMKTRTLTSFYKSEAKCRRTNRRLKFYADHWSRAPLGARLMNEAALEAQSILGPLTGDTLGAIMASARFGGGASFEHSGETSLYYKVSGNHTMTEEIKRLLQCHMMDGPFKEYLIGQSYNVVRGNRVAFVPKNWDKHRTIAIEPSFNMYVQLGVDSVLKRRLRSVGVTLRDQTRNSRSAREGSISGDLVTVDLAAASDSLAIECVRSVMPTCWFKLLDQLRSKEFTLDKGKSWAVYHKFSSMGNGFTFPLESLIFYCFAVVATRHCGEDVTQVRCYGDDLIVPRSAYLLLRELLSYAGFDVNVDKTHAFGPMRESCGTDYINGVNIRPVYLHDSPKTAADLYKLHNRLLAGSFIECPRTLAYLRGLHPTGLIGPWYHGSGVSQLKDILSDDLNWSAGSSVIWDGYFIVDKFDSEVPRSTYHEDTQSPLWPFRCLVPKRFKPKEELKEKGLYLCFLRGISADAHYSTQITGWRVSKKFVAYWPPLSELRSWQSSMRSR